MYKLYFVYDLMMMMMMLMTSIVWIDAVW